MNLVDVLAHYLSPKQTSIAYINLAHATWHFMTPFLDSGALQVSVLGWGHIIS